MIAFCVSGLASRTTRNSTQLQLPLTTRHGEASPDWTIYDFCLDLARLARLGRLGHRNRKRDHHPGWIILRCRLGAVRLTIQRIDDDDREPDRTALIVLQDR